jgi:hypothetical protein
MVADTSEGSRLKNTGRSQLMAGAVENGVLRACLEPARKIPRDVNEAACDLARGVTQTEGYRVSARQRKMIETGFADMKRDLGLTRLRLRGLTGANDEFLLAATVQNLRRLAKAIWPSPEPTASPTPA